MTNEFWEFSLATYADAGVAQSLLAMQDELGLDVNVLLYAGWLASKDLQLTAGHLDALEGQIVQWRRRVVLPLRGLRQELKSYREASALRDEIKALELRSEHQQQDLMWAFFLATDTLPAQKFPLAGNLNLVCRSIVADAASLPALLCHLERSIGV
ncbi:MAG: TIGR02444 family protein [Halioglobus sp.]